MEVIYHSKFQKHLLKYKNRRKKIDHALKIFIENPLNPKLKTHKLSGKLKNYWSFSIDYQLRIVFRFLDKDKVFLLDIGTHGIYQ